MIRLAFDGTIGEGSNTAAVVRSALARGGKVEVRINSYGGDAREGLAIYNLLDGHAGHVRVVVDSIAASAASLIAMAGDEIVMLQSSMIMIHDPAGITAGTAADHEKTAELLNEIGDAFAEIYAKRSGKSVEDVRALMKAETWLDGNSAVESGFATVASVQAASVHVASFDNSKFNFNNMPERIAAMATQGVSKMTTKTKENKPAASGVAGILARAAAAKLSAAEANDIVAAATGEDGVVNELAARDAIIDRVAARDTAPRIVVGADAGGDPEGFAKAVKGQLESKLTNKPVETPFAGMTLPQLAGEFLRAHGIKSVKHDAASVITRAMSVRMDTEAGYHSTSDFPHLLGDVMHRRLNDLYVAADPGISVVAESITVPDFRTKKNVALSSYPEFSEIAEGAEFEWGTLQETAESIAVGVYGRAISVTLQALVNDNLGGIDRSIRDVAFAAANMKASLIVAAFITKHMADGKPLFHLDHGNLLTGGGVGVPPSTAALGHMRKVLRLQKALDGTTPLGYSVDTLVVPAALETVAEQVVSIVQGANRVGNVNPFGGKVSVVADPRLDAINPAAWYGIDSQRPPVQWATLEMTPTPRLEIDDGINGNFATLGTSYRAWQAAGASPVEFRTAVKNDGGFTPPEDEETE